MYLLKDRQVNIVLDLVNTKEPLTAKELSIKYNVSIRTVRYDLQTLEEWLKNRGIDLIRKPRVGIWIECSHSLKEKLLTQIKPINPCVKVLSKEERKKVIVLELLKQSTPVTSEYLAEKTDVSKTTILEDIKEVQKELNSQGIAVEGKPGIGYTVKGNEESIRKFLAYILLSDMGKDELLDMLNTVDLKGKSENLSEVFSVNGDIHLKDIQLAIKASKNIYDFWIPDSSYVSLVVHIAIAVDRLLNNQKIISLSEEKMKLIESYKEYIIAKEISHQLEKIYDIEIPEAEVANITFHLISANLKLNYLHNENIYDIRTDLLKAVDGMVLYLKEKIWLPDESYERLKLDLLSHLKLTLKKYELKIPNNNPLLSQIKTNYFEYYQLSKEMGQVFKDITNIHLIDDEIGYITLHVAAHIEMYKKDTKKNAILVCTTGKGIAKVLEVSLNRSIPELNILQTVSVFDLEDGNIDLEDVDLIISTVHISESIKPVFRISPFVTEKEIEQIKKFIYGNEIALLNMNRNWGEYILDSIMNIANKYVEFEKQNDLRNELECIVSFIMSSFDNRSPYDEFGSFEQFAEDIALILIDIGQMIEELKDSIDLNKFMTNIWGVAIHVIMAIPRWRMGNFATESHADKYKEEYKDVFEVVNKHLNIISRKYNIQIPESEIIAISRYFI